MRLAVIIQATAAVVLTADAFADASFATDAKPRIDSSVHRALKRQGTVNIMVTMREGTDSVLKSLAQEASFPDRGAKIQNMVEKLEAHAAASQSEVTKLMAQESSASLASEMRSFWITNQVYFRDATFELVEKLSSVASVASVEEETITPLPAFTATSNTTTTVNVAATTAAVDGLWGISKIGAPSVWADGTTGQGIVVASMDSGIRTTHELLRNNFRKDFGWYDPYTKAEAPYDTGGHGTYTMGTMVGANGYGVAPGATFITCKIVRPGAGGSTLADQLSCAEFFTCPTNPSGTVRDCSKAPRVVNCEMGGGQGNTVFSTAIAAWGAAGITAIFPAGNTGPNCGTVTSPSDADNMISIGASDSSDGLASFSARGPSNTGLLKVDFVAPGDNVMSSSYDSDTSTVTTGGTSASSPHVGGVIALMLTVNPNLSYDEIRNTLRLTANRSLKATGQTCGNTKDGVYPNNMYGYGRIDALSAVNRVRIPGSCTGLSAATCNGLFFCSYDAAAKTCQKWWS